MVLIYVFNSWYHEISWTSQFVGHIPTNCVLCPGEAPFAEIPTTELLQFHQRGKTLRRPANCSNTLWVPVGVWLGTRSEAHTCSLLLLLLRYSIIKSCCQFKDQDRPSMVDLGRKLLSGEKSASDKVIKVSEKMNIEQYLQEAGYGEANSYTVFWGLSVPGEWNQCTIPLVPPQWCTFTKLWAWGLDPDSAGELWTRRSYFIT